MTEADSDSSGSLSCYSTLPVSSERLPCPSCVCEMEKLNEPSANLDDKVKQEEEANLSLKRRSYEEREIFRKERNNAASRKSRALRKRRFQMMLLETERLTNTNAKLRALVEELNSIMAESRAILFEKFANPPNPDANMAAQQPLNDLRE